MTTLTCHAERRCNQRGFTPAIVALVIEHADREANIGDGCTALEISRQTLDDLRASHRSADRARGIIVVLNNKSEVVTVLKAQNRKAARVYRAGMN